MGMELREADAGLGFSTVLLEENSAFPAIGRPEVNEYLERIIEQAYHGLRFSTRGPLRDDISSHVLRNHSLILGHQTPSQITTPRLPSAGGEKMKVVERP